MTVNSCSDIAAAPFVGLGTFTYNIPATGRYTIDVFSTIPGIQSDAPAAVATPAAQEVQNITFVADSSGSLNSTYFTFYSAGDLHGYYVWFNINSAGVDPAVAGLTGIEVDGATNATAATLAGAARTAIAAVTGISSYFIVLGATTHVILVNNQSGSCTAAANGTASPGFTYSVTQTGSWGMGSGLKIVINKQGTAQYTLGAPSSTQKTMGGSTTLQCTAADVITVVFSSTAAADQFANAVKSTVNIFLAK